MALHDMARMTVSGTPGIGAITLGSAVTGFQTFAASGVINGEVVPYSIADGNAWEVGYGTYTAAGTSLARTSVLFSSNANAAINATSAATVGITILAASGSFTTTFLRADGTWVAPPGSTPGGSTTQIQVNTSSAFAGVTNFTSDGTNVTAERLASTASLDWDSGAGAVDLSLFRDAADISAQRNATNAQVLRVYNTYTNSSNYERAVIDWQTTPNVLTIGGQSAGTGSARNIQIKTSAGATAGWQIDISNILGDLAGGIRLDGTAGNINLWSGGLYITNSDTNIGRPAAGVYSIGTGTTVNSNGWLQWGGLKRVTSNFSTGNSAVLADITGLSVALTAGRTYSFQVYLSLTDAAAGGVQVAMGGNCTVTDLVCDGVLYDNNTVTQGHASALATAIINKTTTATADLICKIDGTITVANAGTLTVQLAQNTGNATGTVALRGSYFIVHDMP